MTRSTKTTTARFALVCLAGAGFMLASVTTADARGGRMGGGMGGGARGGAMNVHGGGGGNFSRPSGGGDFSRPGGGGSGTRDINNNTNRNTNINHNTNINRDVNIDVDNDWHRYGYGTHHPIAAGIAIGTAAAVTAAAIGSVVYSLPPACATWTYYYHCDDTWYEPRYEGTTVTYVVVDAPPGS